MWLTRVAQIHALKVTPKGAALDYLYRRYRHGLIEYIARVGAETTGRVAADIVLMQSIGDPAEDATCPEYRTSDLYIGLMARAYPGIVGQEHVAFVDTDFGSEIFQRPFNREIHGAGEILDMRAEEHELAVFGQDHGIEVVGDTGKGRTGDLLNGDAVFIVDVPQRVPQDLIGDGIEIGGGCAVQVEPGWEFQFGPRDIGIVDAIPGRRRAGFAAHATSCRFRSMMILP